MIGQIAMSGPADPDIRGGRYEKNSKLDVTFYDGRSESSKKKTLLLVAKVIKIDFISFRGSYSRKYFFQRQGSF